MKKVTLHRERTDKYGYDSQGSYWGIGAQLWCADNGKECMYVRAVTRARAKDEVLQKWPNAIFYR